MDNVFQFINTSISTVANWFLTLLDSSGMTAFYLSMVFVFLVGKYILSPIFGIALGVARSDTVKKIRKSSKSKAASGKNQRGNRSK